MEDEINQYYYNYEHKENLDDIPKFKKKPGSPKYII